MIARSSVRRLAATLLISACASSGLAQSLPSAQRGGAVINRRALIVSADLRNPVTSVAANELASILQTSYGFVVTRLDGARATRETISRALQQAAYEGGRQDPLFIVLDLPAQLVAGTTFLVPADGNREQPQTLIRGDEVLFPFAKSDARPVFVMMPVCRATDRFSQTAKGFEGVGAPPGVTLLSYCVERLQDSQPVTRVLAELLGRPDTAARISPPVVAEAINREMPFANVDLRSGFLASDRTFTFDRVRDRLADAVDALARNPTPAAIQRAVTIAGESPADRRSADIERVSGALEEIADIPRDVPLRLRALQAIGQLGSRTSVAALGRIAKGPDDVRVRKAAVEALARIGGAGATPVVRGALSDGDPVVREAAVRAAAALRDTGSRPAIAGLLRRDQAEDVRVACVQALALLQPAGGERDALVDALKDRSAAVRREAANALSGISADVAPDLITVFPGERDPSVQQAIIYALARVPHNAAATFRIESLLRGAVRSTEALVREAAVFALGSFPSLEAKAIVRTALSDPSERVQSAAIQSAAAQRNPDAVPQLIALLDPRTPAALRAAAVESLGKIGDPRAAEPLVARLKDENEYVRLSAQRALPMLQAGDALTRALSDPSPQVKRQAIDALAASKEPVPIPPLVRALGDGDYEVRAAAIRVLSQSAEQGDIVLLVTTLKDSNAVAKTSALEVIGNLATRQPRLDLTDTEAPIDAVLRSPVNTTLQAEAIRTAGRLGRDSWRSPILAASSAENPVVRRAAAEALGRYNGGDSIEALLRLTKDPVLDVQAAAIDSLRRLNVK